MDLIQEKKNGERERNFKRKNDWGEVLATLYYRQKELKNTRQVVSERWRWQGKNCIEEEGNRTGIGSRVTLGRRRHRVKMRKENQDYVRRILSK